MSRGRKGALAALVLAGAFAAAPDALARRAKQTEPTLAPLARIVGEALTSDVAWERLVHLCDRIGHRLSGTQPLDQAVSWATEQMRADGLADVRTEEVLVPVWQRGTASLALVGPREMPLDVLALGGSVGTGPEGIEADVLVVDSLEDLASRDRAEVEGKVVLYDRPFTTYGETVPIRTRGAAAAATLGAVASLVRSVGPSSLQTPHTGNQRYEDGVPPIPAAAVTIEAAELMHRLQDRGTTPRVWLQLGCSMGEPAPSANVIGEVRGREAPDEVVVVGCHLDSWDVGQGAQDDGAGCVGALEVGRLLARLPTPPRRTVRVVLFTNEENGLEGAKAYAEAHGDETHVAAIESDTGAGRAFGFRIDLRPLPNQPPLEWTEVEPRLEDLRGALLPLDAAELIPGYGGADIGPLAALGVPALGLHQDMTGYWPIHHTEADTIDKIDPATFRRNTAVLAAAAWALAEGRPLRP